MASVRLPVGALPPPQPPRAPNPESLRRAAAAAGAAAVAAVAIGALSCSGRSSHSPLTRGSSRGPIWASLSMSQGAQSPSVEPRSGAEFPAETADGRGLLGVGLRRTSILGFTSVDVYAFAVYTNNDDMRQLGKKYETASLSDLKENQQVISDILSHDIRMTVKLQIVYGRLSIRSVRSAFEKSVGNRLRKFGGSETKELLQSFVSLFKDEYKLPKGSAIELSREQGYVLLTKVDGKEVGAIQSKLLCQAILDLYVGDEPIDKNAKSNILSNVAHIIKGDC